MKPKVVVADDCHEIYGFCDLPKDTHSPTEQHPAHLKRLILKTDSHTANNVQIKIKRSLMRKCLNLKVRTDLQSMGIYLMKKWTLKFMCAYEDEEAKNGQDEEALTN